MSAGDFIADVGFLLEGTYPYVSGGVSSWVHDIIRGMPDLTFGLVFLGASPDAYGAIKYQLPANVKHIETHYLSESWQERKVKPRAGRAATFADVERLHEFFRTPKADDNEGRPPAGLMSRLFAPDTGVCRDDFLFSERAWAFIQDAYTKHCTDPSFIDFFWTVRTMHAPLFLLGEITGRLPAFRVLHSVSTGYAGLLGALVHQQTGRPLILTEHGIYTKERKIDLAHAEWIKDAREVFGSGLGDDVGYIRRLWIRFFEGIGRLTYDAANPIVGLYEGAQKQQIAGGAHAARTRLVPNGVQLTRFAPLRKTGSPTVPPIVGLLGRVVPIKDIRTFIRAMHTVCARLPEAEGWIIGPDDEDPAYARECRELVHDLGLDGRVKFLGFQRPEDVLPKLGILALTSISEALPLVLLEAYAAGLPVIATDVGACRDLIEGRTVEDRALGAAGIVVSIADPDATASAALALLTDEPRWRRAQQAGIARVERFYAQPLVLDAYRGIYDEALSR